MQEVMEPMCVEFLIVRGMSHGSNVCNPEAARQVNGYKECPPRPE